jgi:hypothetical protein
MRGPGNGLRKGVGMITANVDLTAPGKGIILLTGDHGFPEDPQALLARHGGGTTGAWTLCDDYADLDRDGETVRKSFYTPTARSIAVAVERWVRHLGIDSADVVIEKSKEY